MVTQERNKELIRARNIVFLLLKFRQRSEKEVRQRLKRKSISDSIIENVVDYFKELTLLDDRQFARSWIRARLLKPFGVKRIRFELKQKGIPDNIINEELTEASHSEGENEAVTALAKKCLSKYKNLEPIKAKRRTYEYLLRRGFTSEQIQKTLQKISKNDTSNDTYDSE